ncbi:MAG TPA: YecA family protein [Polyangiaceae bacterium]|nr:YecA family protein [Polyangiaceae bacterium]
MSRVRTVDIDELVDLYDALHADEDSSLDFDGILGLLHAIACAPQPVDSPVWLASVMPRSATPSESEIDRLRTGLIQQLREVELALAEGSAFIPEPDEAEAWENFARGFVAGAALDPTWHGDPERWALVSWFAYLAGRRADVPGELLETLDADSNASDIICDQAPAMIRAIYAEFQASASRQLTPPYSGGVNARPGSGRDTGVQGGLKNAAKKPANTPKPHSSSKQDSASRRQNHSTGGGGTRTPAQPNERLGQARDRRHPAVPSASRSSSRHGRPTSPGKPRGR